MKIKSIDIDGFGVWKGLALEELSDHATVINGPNEAGKTTLMQFVRAVLYGFTPERRKRYLPPVNGGQPGGRLRVHNEFGSFTIERRSVRRSVRRSPRPCRVSSSRIRRAWARVGAMV